MGNEYFSFTNRDYENARKEGMAKLPAKTNYQWTDLNASDPGIVLLDYIHALVDMCQYYLDHYALESFLTTAKERVNLLRLAKEVSYEVRSTKGALVDIKALISADLDLEDGETVTIPANTTIVQDTNIPFRTLKSVTISTTGDIYEIPCQQGKIASESYTGTGESDQSMTDDNLTGSNQSVTLQGIGIDTDTIEVVGDDGTVWKKVPYVSLESSGDPVYELVINEYNNIIISFGNGVYGKVPQTSDKLTISYISTVGAEGNIAPYIINTTMSLESNISGHYFEVILYNDLPGTGGTDIEEDDELRKHALVSSKTQNRAVTRQDYIDLVSTIAGVAYCAVYDVHNYPDLCTPYEVKVYVSPDTQVESTALVDKVTDFLSSKIVPPTNLYVLSPKSKPIDIAISAKKVTRTLTEDTVEDTILERVTDYIDSLGIGESFNQYDLMSNLQDITGLLSIKSITATTDSDQGDVTDIEKTSRLLLRNVSVSFV